MKKKILILSLFVVVLTCLFAFSVSAAVTTYDDAPTKTKITVSTDDLVVFDDNFTCPSAYIFQDVDTIGKGDHTGNNGLKNALDFSYINEKTGKSYTISNITELDIPEGIVTLSEYAFTRLPFTKISIPKTVKTINGCCFEKMTSLKQCVFEHTESSELTTLNYWTFQGTALTAISLPDCITKIDGECVFANCSSLTAVYLSKNLETYTTSGTNQKSTFYDNKNMYFVNEPFTYDSIPSKPEVYYFPEPLATLSGELFKNCSGLNDVLVFGKNATSITNSWAFEGCGNKSIIVFLADMTDINTSSWKVASVCFANQNDKSSANFNSYSNSKTTVFCNADGNETHIYKVEKKTAATCTEPGVIGYACFCGKASDDAETVPALGHEKNELIAKYFASVNGTLDYYSDMVTEHSCTRCDATIEGTEAGTALFAKKGYSYSEADATTFSYTIYVNEAAIKAYNASLLYGIVVSANVNGTPIAYADGAVSHDNKTIAIEFQNTDVIYSIITAKLTGVDVGTELHLSAYCVDNGEVSYLGHNAVEKLAETVSYEILLEKYPSGKEE